MMFLFFFFNDTATTEIYTLSLHDALPISCTVAPRSPQNRASSAVAMIVATAELARFCGERDRKSTRLNSSHDQISYAVFCLKKKKSCYTQIQPRCLAMILIRKHLVYITRS